MARDWLDSHLNFLRRSTSIISATDPRPLSISILAKPANAVASNNSLFCNNLNNSPALYFELHNSGGSDVLRLFSEAAFVESDTFTISTTEFTQLGVAWETAGAGDGVTFYVNGVATGTANRTLGGGTDPGASLGVLFNAPTFDFDGDLAEFGMYNRILSAGKWTALGQKQRPIDVAHDVASYVPIWGNTDPEVDWADVVSWNVNGTLTKRDHPPILWLPPLRAGASVAGPPVVPQGRTKGFIRRRTATMLAAAQRDDPDGNPTEEYLLLRTDEFGRTRVTP